MRAKASSTAHLRIIAALLLSAVLFLCSACAADQQEPPDQNAGAGFTVPEYAGEPSVEVNGNVPTFSEDLKTEESFEEYGPLDKRGRCTAALANLSEDTEPAYGEERGDISAIHPSGWKSGQGWERCHLIAWKLSAENDNKRNLVTGTHYMNSSGMLPYEDEVSWYIRRTGNHVLYEVEPIFEGKNMVCSGVRMQAESVEDGGKGISFHVYCFNVEPGKQIDYKTGEVSPSGQAAEAAGQSGGNGQGETAVQKDQGQKQTGDARIRVYVLNTNTMRFHYPSCPSVSQTAKHNREKVRTSREELIRQGYEPCGECEP